MGTNKINSARLSKLLTSISDGNYFKVAAPAAGISSMTAYRWMSIGTETLANIRLINPDFEDEVADWLEVWPDNFSPNNGMWDAPPPAGVDPEKWDYVLLVLLAQKAFARAEERHVRNIIKAGKKNWQASAWYLERVHRDRYGRNAVVELEGSNASRVEAVSNEELIARINELNAKRAENRGEIEA